MIWSMYDLKTGILTGRVYLCTVDKFLNMNIPDGCGAVEGRYDPSKFRVDVQNPSSAGDGTMTFNVVDYMPAAATPEQSNALKRDELIAQIVTLETSQHRAHREATLTGDHTRLQAIDDQIVALRAKL